MPQSPEKKKKLGPKNISKNHFSDLIALGRGAPLSFLSPQPVHVAFEAYAYSNPDKPAVFSQQGSFSYSDLNTWAQNIAETLRDNGVGPGRRIAILMPPSAAMVASVLGVLKSGAAYVPLDHTYPPERIDTLLKDAAVSGILADIHDVEQWSTSIYPVYRPGHPPAGDACTGQLISVAHSASIEDPAYLIYTSGSTGEAKGVLVGHRALSCSTHARRMVYSGQATCLLLSPLSCDSSAAGLWGTLTAGGTLVVASYEDRRNPERLLELIKEHQVTQFLCVPSLYQTLLDVIERDDISKNGSTRSLETVIVAGETLHASLVERHFAVLGASVALVNEYGPTETTVWASYRRFNSPAPVSIGGPIPGISLYVLDDDLQLVPYGEAGELFIGGVQIAEGYFARPETTQQTFLADPFAETGGARLYRTGDWVRWNTDGTLDFIGRKDHQVKIRGHRVELGAIEAALVAFPGVRDAVVVADNTGTQLTGFVLAPSRCELETLRQALVRELPAFMVPSKMHILEHFPLTPSGKVDRSALRTMADQLNHSEINPVAHLKEAHLNDESHVITHVATAWRELLGLDSVPEDVNFFDLGGHSLMIFKLQEALERHTGQRPDLVSLFRHTTISAQAQLILDAANRGQSQSSKPEAAA